MKAQRRKYGKIYIVYAWVTRRDKYVFSVENREGDVYWSAFFDSVPDGDEAAMEFADKMASNR